jgi:hypothetical protein
MEPDPTTYQDRYSNIEISEAAALLKRLGRYSDTFTGTGHQMVHIVDGIEVSDYRLLQLAEGERRRHAESILGSPELRHYRLVALDGDARVPSIRRASYCATDETFFAVARGTPRTSLSVGVEEKRGST